MSVRILLAAGSILLAVTAPAAARVPTVPKGFIGMLADGPLLASRHVHLGRELHRMRRAGVQTVRTPFYGTEVQPRPRARTDLSGTDRMVIAAAKARLALLPVVLGVPPWARQTRGVLFSGPSAKRGRAFYTKYMRALIARYGPHGTLWQKHPKLTPRPIRQWQVWNEPDGVYYWHEEPRIDQYADLLEAVSPAIREADPKATIILAGLIGEGGPDLQRLYDRGAGDLFDQVAIHPFTFKIADVLKLLSATRDVMKRNGDARKPIAVTEVSWPSAYKKIPKKRAYGFEVTERGQARRIKQIYRTLARHRRALGIASVHWAAWMSIDRYGYPFNYSGLRRLTRKHVVESKPAYFAFRKVARELTR